VTWIIFERTHGIFDIPARFRCRVISCQLIELCPAAGRPLCAKERSFPDGVADGSNREGFQTPAHGAPGDDCPDEGFANTMRAAE